MNNFAYSSGIFFQNQPGRFYPNQVPPAVYGSGFFNPQGARGVPQFIPNLSQGEPVRGPQSTTINQPGPLTQSISKPQAIANAPSVLGVPQYIPNVLSKGEPVRGPLSTPINQPGPLTQSISKPQAIANAPSVGAGAVPLPFLAGGMNNIKIISDQERELNNRQQKIINLEAQINNFQRELENARTVAEKNIENDLNDLKKEIRKLQRSKERNERKNAENEETINKLRQEIVQLTEEKKAILANVEANSSKSLEETEAVKKLMACYVCTCANMEALTKRMNEEQQAIEKNTVQQSVAVEAANPIQVSARPIDKNTDKSDWEQKFSIISEENDRLRDENDNLHAQMNILQNKMTEFNSLEEKLFQTMASYVCVKACLESSYKLATAKPAKQKPSISEQLQALANSTKPVESEEFI